MPTGMELTVPVALRDPEETRVSRDAGVTMVLPAMMALQVPEAGQAIKENVVQSAQLDQLDPRVTREVKAAVVATRATDTTE